MGRKRKELTVDLNQLLINAINEGKIDLDKVLEATVAGRTKQVEQVLQEGATATAGSDTQTTAKPFEKKAGMRKAMKVKRLPPRKNIEFVDDGTLHKEDIAIDKKIGHSSEIHRRGPVKYVKKRCAICNKEVDIPWNQAKMFADDDNPDDQRISFTCDRH